MIKLKSLINESKILVPRRTPEERERRWIQEIYKKIQDYIKDGSEGTLDLSETPIKILPDNLKKIGGHLDLMESKIENLNNLEYVDGILNLTRTPIKRFPDNLKRINGDLWLNSSKIEDLNNLEYVCGTLDLNKTPIKKLPDNLTKIELSLTLYGSEIQNLNHLNEVGGCLDLRNTPLSEITTEEELRSKIEIGGTVII